MTTTKIAYFIKFTKQLWFVQLNEARKKVYNFPRRN